LLNDRFHILLVDNDFTVLESLVACLSAHGRFVDIAKSSQEAIDKARHRDYTMYFVSLELSGRMSGTETFRAIRGVRADASVTFITSCEMVDRAIVEMKAGAEGYILKPCNPEEVSVVLSRRIAAEKLGRENIGLRKRLARRYCAYDIVGSAPTICQIRDRVSDIAALKSPVLIQGERGTGKRMLARTLHCAGNRASKPFVAVSCTAQQDQLLEYELFGYEKGAKRKRGKLETANGGTVLLDRIEELSPMLQWKLVSFLDGRYSGREVGSENVRPNLRLVTTTCTDLEREVADGTFREDLYFRLRAITFHIPPLRERQEDVPILARHFLEVISNELGKDIRGITDGAMRLLMDYSWPGNVGELKDTVARATMSCRRSMVSEESFLYQLKKTDRNAVSVPVGVTMHDMEKQLILATLQHTLWNVKRAAMTLGIDRSTLYHKMAKYNIGRWNVNTFGASARGPHGTGSRRSRP
jgi:DNA-binding NtrC family response regulator